MARFSSRRALGAGAAALCAGLLSAGVAQASPTTPNPDQTQIGGTTIRPHAVVATPDGKIYVAEFGYFLEESQADGNYQRRVVVYEPNGAGVYPAQPRTIAGTGAACLTTETAAECGEGGPAEDAKLGHVSGLAVDAAGRVYLAENFWARVRVVGTDGNIRTVLGAPGGLNTPEGLAYDAKENEVLVTDKRNDRLLSFPATNGGSTSWKTLAGRNSNGGNTVGARCAAATDPCGDGGPATAASLRQPGAVAVDEAGVIYLADSGAWRVRKVIRGGNITRFAGDGNVCAEADPCGDGGPAVNARFGDPLTPGADGEGPFGIAASDGAVYIADSDINKIRRVLPDGTIETIATVDHPKAPYALRTPAGHDLVIPAWDDNLVTRLRGIDRFDLSVVKAGTGTGTVTGRGIDCGADCTEPAGGTSVTLTATAAAGSTFAGWSGATCTGTAPCTVTVDQARTVTATFTKDTPAPAVQRRLTATVTGSGTITGGGLSCGTTCAATHADGAAVQLTATPAAGQRFVRWTGACTGTTPTCGLTLGADTTVGAVFEAVPVAPPAPKPPTPPVVEPPAQPQPPAATPLRLTSTVVGSRTLASGKGLRLRYTLSTRATLTLEIRPAKGRMQRLALGTRRAGTGTVTWNGRLRGKRVAGRYTVVLVAKAGAVTKRTSVKVTVRR